MKAMYNLRVQYACNDDSSKYKKKVDLEYLLIRSLIQFKTYPNNSK